MDKLNPYEVLGVARVGDIVLSDNRGELVTLPENEVGNLENAIDRAGRGQRLEPIGRVVAAAVVSQARQQPFQELRVLLFGANWGPSPLANISQQNYEMIPFPQAMSPEEWRRSRDI